MAHPRTLAARRRGNTAIFVALASTVLFGVAALTVDLGYIRMVQAQLQNIADAAAHAGSAQLDGTDLGMANAVAMAQYIAERNRVIGQPLVLADEDVTLGNWDATARVFTVTTDAALANTVRVTAQIDSLALLFAPVAVGTTSMAVEARSGMMAARGGAGGVDCFLPLTIPKCLIDRWTLDGLQDVTLNLNPSAIDSMGWGRPNGTPNANWSRDQITSCTQGGTASVGDDVGLQNGVATSAMSELTAAIGASSTTWDTATWGAIPSRLSGSAVSAGDYGNTLEGVVIVFDGGENYCIGSGGSFNGSEPISGFMWAAVYDVRTSGAASGKTIRMRLDTTNDHVIDGDSMGGPDWGVTVLEMPRMVP